jgi:hypothetical protein
MVHAAGWTVRGDPNGVLEFYDKHGRLVGTSTPHQPAPAIPTKQGRARTRLDQLARDRAYRLKLNAA